MALECTRAGHFLATSSTLHISENQTTQAEWCRSGNREWYLNTNGNVQTAQRNPARYTQNRNQRQYDKLMLKAMSNMESNRGTNIHLSRDIPGSSVPLPPTPNVPPSKHSPFVLQASNTAFQYKRNLKESNLPLRFSNTPYGTQRLLQHDFLARSSLSSYASRSNIPSPMRSLYSRHVTSRSLPATQPPTLSPRQVTYVNIIM